MHSTTGDVSWKDSLLWPAYAAGLSVSVVLLKFAVEVARGEKVNIDPGTASASDRDLEDFSWRTYVQQLGGSIVVAFKILRWLACATLVVLAALPILQDVLKHGHHQGYIHILYDKLPQVLLCLTLVRNVDTQFLITQSLISRTLSF